MAEKTLYDILEVNENATQEAIKAAFARLSAQVDPASAPGSEGALRFAAVKDAFFTLGSPVKRAAYDRRLEAQSTPAPPPFWTLPKVALVAVLVVGIGGYSYSSHKTQQARIEAEKQAALARAKEAEQKARAEAEAEISRQQVLRARAAADDAKQARQREQDIRRYNIEESAAQRNARYIEDRDKAAAQRADYQRDAQRRREEQQAVSAAHQQLARDKAALCAMERQRYGKALSCPY